MEDPFRALKELAARLDREIADALHRLDGPKTRSSANAAQMFEGVAATAEKLQLLKSRLQAVVMAKVSNIENLKEQIKQVDSDNEETLRKLIPRGFKVSEDLLPAVQHLSLSDEPTPLEESIASSATSESQFSYGGLMDRDAVFQRGAAGPSRIPKPGQVASQVPKPPQWLQSSQFRRLPIGPAQSRPRLHGYLAGIDNEDTLQLMQRKTPLTAVKSAMKPPPASSKPALGAVATAQLEEPTQAMGFPAPKHGVLAEYFWTGNYPLPETLDQKENILEKEPAKEPRKPKATTPELKQLPPTPFRGIKERTQALAFPPSKDGLGEENFTSRIPVPVKEPGKPTTPELKKLPETPPRLKRRNLESLLNSPR